MGAAFSVSRLEFNNAVWYRVNNVDNPQLTWHSFHYDKNRTYKEAKQFCDDMGAKLATSESDMVNFFFQFHLEETAKEEAWIGLRKSAGPNTWYWEESFNRIGDAEWTRGFTRWAQPNTYKNIDLALSQCAAVRRSDGAWIPKNCEQKLPVTICSIDRNDVGWITGTSNEYKMFLTSAKTPLKAEAAEQKCEALGEDTHLARISSKKESQIVAEMTKASWFNRLDIPGFEFELMANAEAWIGLRVDEENDDTSMWTWYWAGDAMKVPVPFLDKDIESSSVFTNWSEEEEDMRKPNESDTCMIAGTDGGGWKKAECDAEKRVYICSRALDEVNNDDALSDTKEMQENFLKFLDRANHKPPGYFDVKDSASTTQSMGPVMTGILIALLLMVPSLSL